MRELRSLPQERTPNVGQSSQRHNNLAEYLSCRTHAWATLSDIDLDFVRHKQYAQLGINHHEVIREIAVPPFASGGISASPMPRWWLSCLVGLKRAKAGRERVCSEPTRRRGCAPLCSVSDAERSERDLPRCPIANRTVPSPGPIVAVLSPAPLGASHTSNPTHWKPPQQICKLFDICFCCRTPPSPL